MMGKVMKVLKGNFWDDGLSLTEWVVVWLMIIDGVLILTVLTNVALSLFGVCQFSQELFEFFKHVSTTQVAPAILGGAGYSSIKYYAGKNRYSKGCSDYDDYEEGPPI